VEPVVNVAARQERAAGLILDDEGLRGDLTDDEFRPLLDWAIAASDRIAAAVKMPNEEAAMTEIGERVSAVKGAVRLAAEAVAAHVNGVAGQQAWALDALAEMVELGGFQAAVPGVSAGAVHAVAKQLVTDDTGDGVNGAALIVQALTGPVVAGDAPAQAIHSDPSDPSPESAPRMP